MMATAGEESQNNEDSGAAESEENHTSPHCVTPTIPDQVDTALECYNMAAQNPAKLKHIVSCQPDIVNDVDDHDRTALMHSVLHGDLASLKNLIELGWSVNQQDEEGKSPLAIACYQGWYEGVVYLLNSHADQMLTDYKNRLPIHAATHNDKIRCLALLVQHLQPMELNSADDEMMTALHWAAFHDRPEHVQLLISKNVNMFTTDIDGKTPLHWAAQKGNEQCVEILLRESRGSHLVNMKDNSGKGALHYSSAAGHLDTTRCIATSKNCNIHLTDPDDRSVFSYPPFGTIRKLGHTSLFNSGMLCQQLSGIARHLTIRVIPPSMPKYRQALHWAAAMGRANCVDLLLKLGADPSMHDLDAKNALHYAKQAAHEDTVKVLNDAIRGLQRAKRSNMKKPDRYKNGIHKPPSPNQKTGANDSEKQPVANGSVIKADLPHEELPPYMKPVNQDSPVSSKQTSPLNTNTKNSPAKEKKGSDNSKHKLPPIRGSICHNKVQALYQDDDDLVSQDTRTTILTNNHTKSPKKLTHTDSNFSIREEKPSNKAMQFIPTVGLYQDEG